MSPNESENTASELLRRLTRMALPRALKDQISQDLDDYCSTNRDYAPQAAMHIVAGYRVQGAEAWSKVIILAQVAVTVFAFALVTTPFGLGVLLIPVLITLYLYDAYNHEGAGSNRRGVPKRSAGSRLAGILRDCAVSAVSVLAAQAVLVNIAPDALGPRWLLVRATAVFLALLAILRIVLRHVPSGEMPSLQPGESPARLFRKVFVLNLLWMAACIAAVWTNWITVPDFLPQFGYQALMTFLPVFTFALMFRFGQDVYKRDNRIFTLNSDDRQIGERLFQFMLCGLPKTDPDYATYMAAQTLFFIWMAVPLLAGIVDWMGAKPGHINAYDFTVNLSTVLLVLLSWNHVQEVNRNLKAAFGI